MTNSLTVDEAALLAWPDAEDLTNDINSRLKKGWQLLGLPYFQHDVEDKAGKHCQMMILPLVDTVYFSTLQFCKENGVEVTVLRKQQNVARGTIAELDQAGVTIIENKTSKRIALKDIEGVDYR